MSRLATDSRTRVVQAQRDAERFARANAEVLPTSRAREAVLRRIAREASGNDGDTQADRILRAIRETGFVTTFEGRQLLDVAEVSARVWSLRHQRDLPVQTAWVSQVSPAGRMHRVARYFLSK